MPTLIPFVPSDGRYEFTCTIEGDQYQFHVQWNLLEQAWYFDLFEYDDTPIATGIKIVLGTYLMRTYNHPLLLAGVFAAKSNTIQEDPNFDQLGVSTNVYYFTRAEMSARLLNAMTGTSD